MHSDRESCEEKERIHWRSAQSRQGIGVGAHDGNGVPATGPEGGLTDRRQGKWVLAGVIQWEWADMVRFLVGIGMRPENRAMS